MPRPTTNKVNLKDFPEFPVKREVISTLFTPPLPKSTFYDRVKEGRIIPMPELSGYYLLNASLHRLGLPLVRHLPNPLERRSIEDIVRLALSLIDRNRSPMSSPLPPIGEADTKEVDHALRLADQHRDAIEAFPHVEQKLAYLKGVLDAVSMSHGAGNSRFSVDGPTRGEW